MINLEERIVIGYVIGNCLNAGVTDPPIFIGSGQERIYGVMQFDFCRHVRPLPIRLLRDLMPTDSTFAINNYAPPYYLNT